MHCGKPLKEETAEYCRDCMGRESHFIQGRGLWVHKEPVSTAIYQYKYKNRRRYGNVFARELDREFEAQIRRWGIEEIIPIPLHPSKLRKRGYNQAEILGGELSRLLGLPMRRDVLLRIRKTSPQKMLAGEGRYRNVASAFAVSGKWNPKKNVLLVDDIYTTGSTIEGAARLLCSAGAENVYFLTISIGQGL